jgi:hypothetical protein
MSAALSPASIMILTRAAGRLDRRIEFSRTLPTVARRRMIANFEAQNLIVGEMDAIATYAVALPPSDETMLVFPYLITSDGMRAVGIEPLALLGNATVPNTRADTPTSAPEPIPTTGPAFARTGLRVAAEAVLKAWGADTDDRGFDERLQQAMDDLRVALAPKAAGPTTPRAGTKKEMVIEMLKNPEGTTLAAIMEATGWQKHTAGAFISIVTGDNNATIIKTKTDTGLNYRWANT